MRFFSSWLLVSASVLVLAACGGGGGSGTPTVAMVTLTPPMASVMVGQQIQLAATTTYTNGNTSTAPVIWASNNTAVATVNATGLVMALTLGQVTITATSDGQSGTSTLTTTTGITFAMVSAGSNHTCGVTLDGIAYCWGDNSSGQLGNGTMTNSPIPVSVSSALNFAMVSAGNQHTCGVTGNPTTFPLVGGTVYCWGNNSAGQLGNGGTTNSAIPVAVSGGGMAFTVTAGGQHSCDISSASILYCWGDNTYGQLGNGTTTNSTTPTPVAIVGGFPWNQVSAGSSQTCSSYQTPGEFYLNSFAYCWGDNSSGQLGNGTTTSSNTPVSIFTGIYQTSVSAGTLYTCVTNFGPSFAMCSGNNTYGQLGNGTMTSSASLVAVLDSRNQQIEFESAISAGTRHACGLFGPAYCWGDNTYGQLGNGTTMNSATPIIVAGGLNFGVVSAGGAHTCGVLDSNLPGNPPSGGAVYCWGDNTYGQLGNSWTMSSSVPVNVAGPP